MSPDAERVAGSFRDPAGFIFRRDGVLYRHVGDGARESLTMLHESGLYDALVSDGLLVSHEEMPDPQTLSPGAWKVLRPEPVPFVSWPYEWCFGQLRAAALLTLRIAEKALDHGMMLKDASAYNVQFLDGARPVFIDTLSFEPRREGAPWPAYRQFCQHFLAPLALAARTDVRVLGTMRTFIDGMPLEMASALLPKTTKLRPSLAAHIHLHGRMESRGNAGGGGSAKKANVSERGLRGLLDNLRSAVEGMTWKPDSTVWAGYYQDTNYTSDALEAKKRLVREFVEAITPKTVWDLGANTGVFSQVAAETGARVIALEGDYGAAEKHYEAAAAGERPGVLPLVCDLTNPSPSLGWNFAERPSLAGRGPADCLMALALVHHLAIGNNVPLPSVAEFLRGLGRTLIIEWVPKSDSQVQRLLSTREDIFPDYTAEGFETAFARQWETVAREPVPGTERVLYRMEAGER